MKLIESEARLNDREADAYRAVVNSGMATPAQRHHVKQMQERIDYILLKHPKMFKNGIRVATPGHEVVEVRMP